MTIRKWPTIPIIRMLKVAHLNGELRQDYLYCNPQGAAAYSFDKVIKERQNLNHYDIRKDNEPDVQVNRHSL